MKQKTKENPETEEIKTGTIFTSEGDIFSVIGKSDKIEKVWICKSDKFFGEWGFEEEHILKNKKVA